MTYGYGVAAGALIIALLLWPIIVIVFYVLGSLGLMRIFAKAGVQSPGVAWIPVYSTMVLAKLADLNPWLVLIGWGASIVLGWVPVLGWIIGIAVLALTVFMLIRVNTKLGKEVVGWTIFGGLLFPIWAMVVGYGQTAPWRTGVQAGIPAPFWRPWGTFFSDTTTWGGVPYQGYAAAGPAAPPAAPPTA